MASKKEILRKIKIVLTQNFESEEAAFAFFDKDKDGKLSKKEIVSLLKEAKISSFLRGIVSKKLIETYDEDGDAKVNWKEFKKAIKKM
ncbi:MAG: EF-hand domain-containing protein [Flavobacteriaceae bacterium]